MDDSTPLSVNPVAPRSGIWTRLAIAVLLIVPMLTPVIALWGSRPVPFGVRVPGEVREVAVYLDDTLGVSTNGTISTVSFRIRPMSRLQWLWYRHQRGITVDPEARPFGPNTEIPLRIDDRDGTAQYPNELSGVAELEKAQQMAVVAASRVAGKPVRMRGSGVVFPQSYVTRNQVVTSVDGRRVRTYGDYVGAVASARAQGRTSLLLGLGRRETLRVRMPRVADIQLYGPGGLPVMTVNPIVTASHTIEFANLEQGASGPSGGLAYALGVYIALTDRSLLRGRDIVATGTIQPDGSVGIISGIEPKVRAAIDVGADMIVVPRPLERDARRIAGDDIAVLGVSSLQEAVSRLQGREGDRTR